MIMKSKIFSFVLASLLALSMVACSEQPPDDNAADIILAAGDNGSVTDENSQDKTDLDKEDPSESESDNTICGYVLLDPYAEQENSSPAQTEAPQIQSNSEYNDCFEAYNGPVVTEISSGAYSPADSTDNNDDDQKIIVDWVCTSEHPDNEMTFNGINSANEAEFTIKSNCSVELSYALYPNVQVSDGASEEAEWSDFAPAYDIAVPEIACIILPGETSVYTIPLEWYDFEKGRLYRVNVDLGEEVVSCEFTID